jgi:hypothetical protein
MISCSIMPSQKCVGIIIRPLTITNVTPACDVRGYSTIHTVPGQPPHVQAYSVHGSVCLHPRPASTANLTTSLQLHMHVSNYSSKGMYHTWETAQLSTFDSLRTQPVGLLDPRWHRHSKSM